MHTRIAFVVALALVAFGATQTRKTANHSVRVASATADSTTSEHRSGYIIASS